MEKLLPYATEELEKSFSEYSPIKGSNFAQIYAPDDIKSWMSIPEVKRKDYLKYAIRTVLVHATSLVSKLKPYPRTLLCFNQKDESYTEGTNYIVVSTYPYSPAYSLMTGEYAFDIVLGLTAHEISHLLYTDFKAAAYFFKPYISRIEEYKKDKKNEEFQSELKKLKLLKMMHNIIEDERIEYLLTEEFPDTIEYITAVKTHYFKLVDVAMTGVNKETVSLTLFDEIVRGTLNRIRMPESINSDVYQKYQEEFFTPLEKILTPYPLTDLDVHDASVEVTNLLLSFYEAHKDEIQEQEKEGEQKNLNAAIEKIVKILSDLASKNSEDKIDEELEKILSEIEEEQGDPDANEPEKEEEDAPDLVEANVLPTSIRPDPVHVTSDDKETARIVLREADSLRFSAKGDSTSFIKKTGNKNKYAEQVEMIRPLIPALRKRLMLQSLDKDISMRGMRTGHLDTDKLAEAVQGSQTIYKKTQFVKTQKLCICLVGDQSGSMDGDKIKQARLALVLLTEVFRKMISVDLFVYGHSADVPEIGVTYVNVFVEPGYNHPEALTSFSAQGMNRDGDALLKISQRIRAHTEAPCLMFVLSDGQPNAVFYGDRGIVHTQKVVKQLTSKGFLPFHIAIEAGIPSEKMFENYVTLTKLSQLPELLGAYVKKAYTKMLKKVITYG